MWLSWFLYLRVSLGANWGVSRVTFLPGSSGEGSASKFIQFVGKTHFFGTTEQRSPQNPFSLGASYSSMGPTLHLGPPATAGGAVFLTHPSHTSDPWLLTLLHLSDWLFCLLLSRAHVTTVNSSHLWESPYFKVICLVTWLPSAKSS